MRKVEEMAAHVKREGTAHSMASIWEQRFHRLAATAFSHGLPAAAIAEIAETVEANGEPAECSTMWLGRCVHVEGKAGLGSVRFVGKTAFADGAWLGIEMDEAVGKHDGTVDGVGYFQCKLGHGLMVPSLSGHVNIAAVAEAAAQAENEAAAPAMDEGNDEIHDHGMRQWCQDVPCGSVVPLALSSSEVPTAPEPVTRTSSDEAATVDAEARSTKRARLSSTSNPDTEQSTPTPSASNPDTEQSTPTPSASWFLFHANVNGTVHRLLMHEGATLHDVVCLAFEHFLAGAWGDEMRSHLWSVTVYTSGGHSQYTGYDSALNEELRDEYFCHEYLDVDDEVGGDDGRCDAISLGELELREKDHLKLCYDMGDTRRLVFKVKRPSLTPTLTPTPTQSNPDPKPHGSRSRSSASLTRRVRRGRRASIWGRKSCLPVVRCSRMPSEWRPLSTAPRPPRTSRATTCGRGGSASTSSRKRLSGCPVRAMEEAYRLHAGTYMHACICIHASP